MEQDICSLQSKTTYTEDLTKKNRICLVHGYVRDQHKEDIPAEIIRLFYEYFETATYWKMNENLFSQMKLAKYDQTFYSKRFKYDVNNTIIEFYIQMEIVIINAESNHCKYWIMMDTTTSNVNSIIAICKCSIFSDERTIRMFKQAQVFTKEIQWTGGECFQLNEIDDKESPQFEVVIDFIAIENDQKCLVYLNNHDFEIDKELEFEWKIEAEMLKEWKNAPVGKTYYSKTFGKGGNWCMYVAPNGDIHEDNGYVVLFADLLRVNDGINYKVVCKYRFIMICDGVEISFEEPAEFEMDHNVWFWPKNTYSAERLQSVSTVTVYMKIWDIEVKKKE
eukprot:291805_1